MYFDVEIHDWVFSRAIETGVFELRRYGSVHLIYLACFKIEALWFMAGWHALRFHLKEGDHWGRIMYWGLLNGKHVDNRGERSGSGSLGTVQEQW